MEMEHTVKAILFGLLFAGAYGKVEIVEHVMIKTKFATVMGTLETTTVANDYHLEEKTSYLAFRSIPYAEPPIGAMRWRDPIVKQPFPEGTFYNATVDKNPCPQWINKDNSSVLIGDEDCLYASIFVPLQKKRHARIPLKIMVFFHGGGFIVNSNRNTLPTPLLTHKNAMIVMFNYRISILGYLSTGTPLLAGNYAFLDQITLLKWIQRHGKEFGGDINDVTIFGSSIGSVSVHYLLLSKLCTGLFHKVIMESGSAFCERSLVPNPLDISIKLGTKLGCPTTTDKLLVECLYSKTTVELMLAAKSLTTQWVLPSVLGPVLDRSTRLPQNQFLPDYPENLPVINKVPVLVGITADEGLTAFVKLSKDFNWEQLHNLEFIRTFILPHYLDLVMRWRTPQHQRHNFIKNLTKQVMRYYGDDFDKDPISTLVGILGDLWITTCHRKTLEHLCINNVPSVHTYLFTHHDPGVSPSEIDKEIHSFRVAGIDHTSLDRGVAHTEEILYILEEELDAKSLHESRIEQYSRNKLMSNILSLIWTGFATATSSYAGPRIVGWPKWNPICHVKNNQSLYDPHYPLYEISLDNHRHFHDYRLKEVNFWWRIHQDTYTEKRP